MSSSNMDSPVKEYAVEATVISEGVGFSARANDPTVLGPRFPSESDRAGHGAAILLVVLVVDASVAFVVDIVRVCVADVPVVQGRQW